MRALLRGGGWINREGFPLVERAIAMTGLSRPTILIAPAPVSSPPSTEIEDIKATFGDVADVQSLTDDTQTLPDPAVARRLILRAHVIVCTGGNFTQQTANDVTSHVGTLLRAAAEADTAVFVTSSAGTMRMFAGGLTNSPRLNRSAGDEGDRSMRIIYNGGPLPAVVVPHGGEPVDSTGITWDEYFRMAMTTTPSGTVGIRIGTHSTLVVNGDQVGFMADTDRYTHVQKLVHRGGGNLATTTYNTYQAEHNGTTIPFSKFFA